ncbi:MAG: hypothetical protein MI747_07135 [Desulfobacterales bacterium]|nr:hypothetical protein [Desulfobacterales bacterium]
METRQCPRCQGEMRISELTKNRVDSPFWSPGPIRYQCPDCPHGVALLPAAALWVNGLTLAMALGLVAWFCLSFDQWLGLWGLGAGGMALAGGVALVGLVLVLGGLYNGGVLWQGLVRRRAHPVLEAPGRLGRFLLGALISALPVALAVAIGFYDHYVRDIPQDTGIFFIPLIFTPLFLGSRLGISFLALFLGCAAWMGALIALILSH